MWDFIAEGFISVLDFIQESIDCVFDFFHAHMQWVIDLWEITPLSFLTKSWNFFTDAFQGRVDALSSLIPVFSWDFSFISSPMWVLVNEWIPVSYCFVCFGIWVTTAITVYVLNWVLGIVPTVS